MVSLAACPASASHNLHTLALLSKGGFRNELEANTGHRAMEATLSWRKIQDTGTVIQQRLREHLKEAPESVASPLEFLSTPPNAKHQRFQKEALPAPNSNNFTSYWGLVQS